MKHVANPPDGASFKRIRNTNENMGTTRSIGSPDRLDALVWAITDLSLNGYAKPKLTLAYSSAKGLSQK